MKLALCLFKYFPYGGLQRNFLAIAQELIARGHELTVYTGSWGGNVLMESRSRYCRCRVGAIIVKIKIFTGSYNKH